MLGIAREICANEIGALVIASDMLSGATDRTHARRYPSGRKMGGVARRNIATTQAAMTASGRLHGFAWG